MIFSVKIACDLVGEAREAVVRFRGLAALSRRSAGDGHGEIQGADSSARPLFRDAASVGDPASLRLIADAVKRSAAGGTAVQGLRTDVDLEELRRRATAGEVAGSFVCGVSRYAEENVSAEDIGCCSGGEPGAGCRGFVAMSFVRMAVCGGLGARRGRAGQQCEQQDGLPYR